MLSVLEVDAWSWVRMAEDLMAMEGGRLWLKELKEEQLRKKSTTGKVRANRGSRQDERDGSSFQQSGRVSHETPSSQSTTFAPWIGGGIEEGLPNDGEERLAPPCRVSINACLVARERPVDWRKCRTAQRRMCTNVPLHCRTTAVILGASCMRRTLPSFASNEAWGMGRAWGQHGGHRGLGGLGPGAQSTQRQCAACLQENQDWPRRPTGLASRHATPRHSHTPSRLPSYSTYAVLLRTT